MLIEPESPAHIPKLSKAANGLMGAYVELTLKIPSFIEILIKEFSFSLYNPY